MLISRFSQKIRRAYRNQKRFIRRYFKRILLLLIPTLLILRYCFITYYNNESKFTTYAYKDLNSDKDHSFFDGCIDTQAYLEDESYRKMNATFVMLTRNEELKDVLHTIESIESHFNQWFQYPYVFLNDEPFNEYFKTEVMKMTRAKIEFGQINEIDWNFPDDIKNSPFFYEAMESQSDRGIMYGSMESYHKMCRFYSGMFYKHPLVKQYEWYWRIEPDVDFYCDIPYDPFLEMEITNKKYGFTIIIHELYWSVPNLFRYTQSFLKENKWIHLGSLWKLFTYNLNLMKTDDKEISDWVHLERDLEPKLREKIILESFRVGKYHDDEEAMEILINKAQSKAPLFEDKFNNQEFNLCHFWSNFEIAKISVFENKIYDSYFQYLEAHEGFWRERWGDAPIHSLGLGLTLDVEDIHYFRDIGYRHSTLKHCPKNALQDPKDSSKNYIPVEERFARRGLKAKYDKGVEFGTGCRCKCPWRLEDIEDSSYPCFDTWLELAHDMHLETSFDGEYHPRIDVEKVEERLRKEILQ